MGVRILLAVHHPSIRKGLRAILEEVPRWEIIAEATDGLDAVRQAETLQPDVAIIDFAMPSIDGLEVTRQVTQRSPRTHVLVVGSYTSETYLSQVRQAGARGYVLTNSAESELLKAVTALSYGRPFFDSSVAECTQ